MAILAIGGEADCFELNAGTFTWTTTGGRYNANASRGALLSQGAGVAEPILRMASAATNVWLHVEWFRTTTAILSGSNIIQFRNGNTSAFRVVLLTGYIWQFQTFKSGSWVTLGQTAGQVIGTDTRVTIDIHFNMASSGKVELFANSVSVLSLDVDTTTDVADIDNILFSGQNSTNSNNATYISQVVIADESTVGMVVVTNSATANGTHTDWTGGYTDISPAELTTGTFISSADPDEVSSFVASDIHATFSAYEVRAVAVAVAGTVDNSATVDDIQAVVVVGGNVHTSPNLGFVKNSSTQMRQVIMSQNPETSAPWAQSEVNAMEFGVKSVA